MSTQSSPPPGITNSNASELTSEDDLLYHLAQGNEHFDASGWTAAREHFEQALLISPGHVQAGKMLGTIHFKLGLFADAKRVFYGLIDKHPMDPGLYLSLATVLMRQGNLEEAEDTLQTLLQIEPKHDRGHHSLGVVYRQMNRLEESRAHFLLAGSHAQAETVLDVLCGDDDVPALSDDVISSIASDAIEMVESNEDPFSCLDLETEEPLVRDGSSWESYVSHFPGMPARNADDEDAGESDEDLLDQHLSYPAPDLASGAAVFDTIDLDTQSLMVMPDEADHIPEIQRQSQIAHTGFQTSEQPGSDAWLHVDGQAFIRSSILVAATGDISVEPCDVPATSNVFLKVEGCGKCLVRVPNIVATVKDVRRIFVRASALAGFEGDLSWRRTDALGTAVMELEGHGSVLLNSPQRAILAKVEASSPLHIRKDMFLAWSKDVQICDAKMAGVSGQHVKFEGMGMVILAGSNIV
jgi:tetratricopeptide (TPR) repeat protein